MEYFYAQEKQLVTGSETEYRRMYDRQGSASSFVIAPHDAINKDGADLVLTGVPADDYTAISNALTNLFTFNETLSTGKKTQAGSNVNNIKVSIDETNDLSSYVGCYLIIDGEQRIISGASQASNIIYLDSGLTTPPNENTDYIIKSNLPIRIDFLSGNIDLGENAITNKYSNFHYYGNGVKIKSTNDYAMYLQGPHNIKIEGFNFYNKGCMITNGLINNCHIDLVDADNGFSISSGLISNCTITRCINGSTGYFCWGGSIENCSIDNLEDANGFNSGYSYRIKNCSINNVIATTATCVGFLLESGYDSMLTNCFIGTIKQAAINVMAIGFNVNAQEGHISNCLIEKIEGLEYVSTSSYAVGIQSYFSIKISNNYIASVSDNAVGILIYVGNADVDNNMIQAVGNNGIGILSEGGWYHSISNNHILELTQDAIGIKLDGADRININSNYIGTDGHNSASGITGTGSNCFITNNAVTFQYPESVKISVSGTGNTKKNNLEGNSNFVA